jgi:ABC-type glycerol-3-phosphate transport system substrate-binding protein
VSSRRIRAATAGAAALALVLAAAACGGGGGGGGGRSSTESSAAATPSAANVSGTVTFDGIWTGAEQKNFQKVIDGFEQQYPNVKVKYKAVGDQLPTVLSTAVAGGNPPDMADIAQPGLIQQFVDKGALKPIEYARSDISANFADSWLKLGTFDDKLYGIVFKASNKSLLWYNVKVFKDAGVTAPKTGDELQTAAKTIKASGVTPYSIGGADGWTLTDLFENIYLNQAGFDSYQKLTKHQIKWTDPSVKKALTTMGQVLQGDLVAGGTSGALQVDFPTSVTQVFSDPPKAAMVFEGDFVAGNILSSTKAKPKTGFDVVPFPSVGSTSGNVEVGGDILVAFNDTPAIEAFVKYLATPEAARAWASQGGFATGNNKLEASVYPDAITRRTASAIAEAKNVVFDMSDQQPAAFGATVGQGEWGIFQDFLKNPSDVDGIAQKLESAAAKAYKKS